jgi:hypothetical protein
VATCGGTDYNLSQSTQQNHANQTKNLIGAVLADNFATSIMKADDALTFITEEETTMFFPLGLGVVIND